MTVNQEPPFIQAVDLSIGYGEQIIQRNLNFSIKAHQIIVIMGGIGSGKSTLLQTLVGLTPPLEGDVFYEGVSFWKQSPLERDNAERQFGMMYQHGALWNSMTLEENIMLPLRELANLSKEQARHIAKYKLTLAGLSGYENYFPYEVSIGMRKRVSMVRAMALDPKILFLDEPSESMDPIYEQWLHELLRTLRDAFGTTILIATNNIPMIYSVADYILFLDPYTQTISAQGDLNALLSMDKDTLVYQYLTANQFFQRELM